MDFKLAFFVMVVLFGISVIILKSQKETADKLKDKLSRIDKNYDSLAENRRELRDCYRILSLRSGLDADIINKGFIIFRRANHIEQANQDIGDDLSRSEYLRNSKVVANLVSEQAVDQIELHDLINSYVYNYGKWTFEEVEANLLKAWNIKQAQQKQ